MYGKYKNKMFYDLKGEPSTVFVGSVDNKNNPMDTADSFTKS